MAGDLAVVTDFRTRFVAEVRGIDPTTLPPVFPERTLENHLRSFRAGRLRSWVARAAEEPIGVVACLVDEVPPRPEDPRELQGFVTNLYVVPTHRGRGVARELLARCIDDARATGVRMLGLHTTPDGRPLYEGHGFRAAPTWLELDVRDAC